MADAEVLMIGFFSVFGLAGAIIFYGAIKGWKPLVDPDDQEEDTPFVNSQVVLKKNNWPENASCSYHTHGTYFLPHWNLWCHNGIKHAGR